MNNNSTGLGPEKEKELDIPRKMEDLDYAVKSLAEVVVKLIAKLSPIISPTVQDSSAKAPALAKAFSCSLSGDILAITNRVEDIKESLLITIEHLEI